MKTIIFSLIISISTFAVFANTESPYVGQEKREIKALSAQEIEGYLNGKGLGYAKVAELNQYPGPSHILDLSKELSLTEEQIRKTQTVLNSMKDEAINYGERLIVKEQELDLKFANKTIDSGALKKLLFDIGVLESKIRYVHLIAHLEQKSILNRHQIQQYDHLRGYGTQHNNGQKHSH